MMPTTLIVNQAAPGAELPNYSVVTIDSQRSVRNAAPDPTSRTQAQALAAYVVACQGGSLLAPGQTIVDPSGLTLTAA